ncbi:uncharacterized protein LOC144432041 [Styela clava]
MAKNMIQYDGSDWPLYCEQLEQYFIANDIADEKKVPTLIANLPTKTYQILHNLLALDLPSSKTYDVMKKTLQDHLKPKRSVFVERFAFHRRDQKFSEGVREYAAELRKLSEGCKFGPLKDDFIRDRLIFGILDEATRKRLMAKDGEKLDLQRAFQIATSMELANRDVAEISSGSVMPMVKEHYFSGKQRFNTLKCKHCGETAHDFKNCRYKNFQCFNCGRRGHIQQVCTRR